MADIAITGLEDNLIAKLQIRADRHRRSLEAEAHEILRAALADDESESVNLAERIHGRFGALGGIELDLPPREFKAE